jgi:hypothetical protein
MHGDYRGGVHGRGVTIGRLLMFDAEIKALTRWQSLRTLVEPDVSGRDHIS